MLNKVIKKLYAADVAAGVKDSKYNVKGERPVLRSSSVGFHAKESSLKGAARARSIGNRDSKSG